MKLSSIPFEKIENGTKIIESRLFDEKRQAISLGDSIIFSMSDDPSRKVSTEVIGLLRYASFKQLFKDHDPKMFGGETAEDLLHEIKQFYSDEDESKYGVLGIRLAKID